MRGCAGRQGSKGSSPPSIHPIHPTHNTAFAGRNKKGQHSKMSWVCLSIKKTLSDVYQLDTISESFAKLHFRALSACVSGFFSFHFSLSHQPRTSKRHFHFTILLSLLLLSNLSNSHDRVWRQSYYNHAVNRKSTSQQRRRRRGIADGRLRKH